MCQSLRYESSLFVWSLIHNVMNDNLLKMLITGTSQHLDWNSFQIAFLHWTTFIHCLLVVILSHHYQLWEPSSFCLPSIPQGLHTILWGMLMNFYGNRNLTRNRLSELPNTQPLSKLQILFVFCFQSITIPCLFLKWYFVLDNRDVSHNQISEIPADFRKGFTLLDFTDNNLTSIPDRMMRSVQSSSRYFFDNNKITKLPKMHVDKMKTLSLSYNSIKEFPTSFSSLSYLFVTSSQCHLLCSCFMLFGTDGLITTN